MSNNGPVAHYPPELLSTICSYVYSLGLPSSAPALDPLILTDYGAPTSLPSTLPGANWSEVTARHTLSNLCLVNQLWFNAAKPWLWRRVEIRLPRSWLSLVDEITGENMSEGLVDDTHFVLDQCIKDAAAISAPARLALGHDFCADSVEKFHESVLDTLTGPDGSVPPELLSPFASRESSPRRTREKSRSPIRWKLMRSISEAVQTILQCQSPGVYIPLPQDRHPGRFLRHLDFNHFRTIGMRRSVEEGSKSRFVTGERLEAVLKEVPNLVTFGATEYMDGALTLPVMKELFLRGYPSRGRGRSTRGRNTEPFDQEEDDRERRADCLDLEAVDLTGCLSAVFVDALTTFVDTYVAARDSSSPDPLTQANTRGALSEAATFPGLYRLGLRGVKSIPAGVLSSFVLACPSLTHLDLSGTRAAPELLEALGASYTVRLSSLALSRCTRLTGAAIIAFLVSSPVTRGITQLSLYGDATYPAPFTDRELTDLITQAPAFTAGALTYLDLSSAMVSPAHLASFALQPSLVSLGLSFIPDLSLESVADFLRVKAPNTEIVTLVSSTAELSRIGMGVTGRQASMALHMSLINPLCSKPFSIVPTPSSVPPTRLRVVELAMNFLTTLSGRNGPWRVVRSKGGRGWYVDTASGWVCLPGEEAPEGRDMARDLAPEHPLRIEVDKLADANGNVSSGVGWHARKMEVLHGQGLLGREDGLYGAVSFAYQG